MASFIYKPAYVLLYIFNVGLVIETIFDSPKSGLNLQTKRIFYTSLYLLNMSL